MKKETRFLKTTSALLALVTLICILYAGSITAHAVSGPRPSNEAGILVGFTRFGDWELIYQGNSKKTSADFEGFHYNKKTNTLTLNNIGNEDYYYLEVYDMGDDFKINVKGKNSLGYIAAYSNAKDRMNLTITGNGSLVINRDGAYGAAIHGYANGKSNTKITIDNTVNVFMYGGENIFTGKSEKVIMVEDAKSGKHTSVFRIGGKKTGSTKIVRKKSKKGYTYSYGSTGSLVIKKSGKSFLSSSSSSSTTVTKTSLSKASISVGSATFNGKARKPSVTVKLNGKTLKKDKDYTVSYSNNVNAGKKAVVTIKGTGNYKGTATKKFTINKCGMGKEYISAELNKTSYEYTGKEIKPGITVYFKGKTKLKKGTDYTVSYLYNKKIGKAYVEVTGKGNFKSTARLFGFNITKAKQPIKLSSGSFSVPYAKLGESQYVSVSGIKESAGLTVTSSDESVATIKKADSKYKITFRGIGTTTLKFKTNKATTHYKVTAKSIKVTVVDNRKVPSITSSKDTYSVMMNAKTFSLGAKTNSDGAISYATADNTIATVDASGNITLTGKIGSTRITISTKETKTFKAGTKEVTVTVTDLNDPSYYMKQKWGSSNCTLYACAHMYIRRAVLDGRSEWTAITSNAVEDENSAFAKAVWTNGTGLKGSFTYTLADGYSLSGKCVDINGISKDTLKQLLKEHPEGIECYDENLPHGVLVTSYDEATGTFYCVDSDPGQPEGIIKLSDCLIGDKRGNNQDNVLANIGKYWYLEN